MNGVGTFVLRVTLLATALTVAAILVGGLPARVPDAKPPIARIDRTVEPVIVAEAVLFRGRMRAAPAEAERRNTAHPRTLAMFRALRPYPGAPPRIPHGLTADEYRNTRCRTCHERGGYSMRFEAYAPMTPHPQFVDCLQCHVADDALVGVALPSSSPNTLCRQCHAASAAKRTSIAHDWRGAAWPQLAATSSDAAPPAIPHELLIRDDCNACHAGPGAVAEIRTKHPERENCRQCHVTTSSEGEFRRFRGAQ